MINEYIIFIHLFWECSLTLYWSSTQSAFFTQIEKENDWVHNIGVSNTNRESTQCN